MYYIPQKISNTAYRTHHKERVMNNAFGHLEGVVTKIEKHGQGHITFEVKAVNGVTCYASDIYGIKRPFPIEVGMKVCLEEASVSFDNGRVEYNVDEELWGVELNGVDLNLFIQRRA